MRFGSLAVWQSGSLGAARRLSARRALRVLRALVCMVPHAVLLLLCSVRPRLMRVLSAAAGQRPSLPNAQPPNRCNRTQPFPNTRSTPSGRKAVHRRAPLLLVASAARLRSDNPRPSRRPASGELRECDCALSLADRPCAMMASWQRAATRAMTSRWGACLSTPAIGAARGRGVRWTSPEGFDERSPAPPRWSWHGSRPWWWAAVITLPAP